MKNELKIVEKAFEDRQIRTIWDSNEEKFYISVVDIVGVLADSKEPRKYWSWFKTKLKKEEDFELSSITRQLKLKAHDGKYYNTDVCDIEGMFRLIESIPSKKAEPIKMWLARLGKERIDEEYDPEITINRALETYKRKGYSDEWINQRLKSIDARKEFTDELKNKGIESSKDFAILTNILTSVWSGYSVKEYAEVSSTEISKSSNDKSDNSVKKSIVKGGNVAKTAKEQIEKETGKKIVSSSNNKNIKQIDNN